jgi:plasmid stabilization system protein ParE
LETEFEIVWTEPAVAAFEEIVTHIAESNQSAADRTAAGILEHVAMLKSFPLIGPIYPRRPGGHLREIAYRKYRVFYRVVEARNRVEILTVWHGSRDEPELGD